MRQAFSLGRFLPGNGRSNLLRSLPRRFRYHTQLQPKHTFTGRGYSRGGTRTALLCAALTPAAFLKLSEEGTNNGKTGEEEMLAASRAEIRKQIPRDEHGLRRLVNTIVFVFDQYIYEPIATGFRFLHLVVIFVPVIFTVPVIWFGRRKKDRDNERSGTLWWYSFLVSSMERAGPAFIKV